MTRQSKGGERVKQTVAMHSRQSCEEAVSDEEALLQRSGAALRDQPRVKRAVGVVLQLHPIAAFVHNTARGNATPHTCFSLLSAFSSRRNEATAASTRNKNCLRKNDSFSLDRTWKVL